MKNYTNFIKVGVFILILLVIVISCRNSSADSNLSGERVAVKMNMKGVEFEGDGALGSQASLNRSMGNNGLSVQRQNIQLNKDLMLTAELVPVSSVQNKAQASLSNVVSAVETGDLAAGVIYKVVVYDSNGTYVTERDYTRGQENNTPELLLDGGSSYTFIVYSVNSSNASSLPPITFSDPLNKTLSTSSVSSPTFGFFDVMYFRKDIIVSGNGPNYLDIILKHKFSQVTTTIDASATGYNITAITANIGNISTSASMQLSDGSIIRGGGTAQQVLNFTGLNTMVVRAGSTILNIDTTAGVLAIGSITIGTVTRSDLVLNSLTIKPGIKYNLNVTINPTDVYLTYQGQSAAKINGKIWMRYSLGDNRTNPDTGPFDQYNYYQWGRNIVVANAQTPAGAISGWDSSTLPPQNSWNLGTETSPIKNTANDPCPTGYRIPTKTEYEQLIANTVQQDIGTWSQLPSNYSAATVFTSKINNNVILTIPAAGDRNFTNGALSGRGSGGFYWSGTYDTSAALLRLSGNNNVGIGGSVRTWGMTLRCIAE